MKNQPQCKACPKREGCTDEITPPTDEEVNTAFSELEKIESLVDGLAKSLMNGMPIGLQWVFWNMLANKYRALAGMFRQMLPDDMGDNDIDWANIRSIKDLAADEEPDSRQDDNPDWFKDTKEV